MIDFRYHLVSLMAVLVALTMGVVLGAGPLQGKISDTLSGQVTALSKQQTELRQANEDLVKQANSSNEYIGVLARKVTPGTMTGRKVAVVRMPGVSNEAVNGINAQLKMAGAAITDSVTVKDSWFNEDTQSYRDTLASTLASKLGDKADAKVSSQQVLATALGMGLTSSDKEIQTLVTSLSAGDTPLISASAVTDPAQLIVVGSAQSEGDYLSQIRVEKIEVTTVDSIGSVMSNVSTPFALLADEAGNNQAYGTEHYATQLIPPIPQAKVEGQ